MTKLFISYSSDDKLFALDLSDTLTQRGFETWIFARDGKDIKEGDYSNVLDGAMDDCDMMVYLVTPRSLSSPNRRIEMKRFLDAGKPIIPLVLEPTALPDELDRENAVHHMDNFAETAEAISEQVIRLSAATSQTDAADIPLIFISYPRSETQFARRIDNALRANGYRTWVYARDYDRSREREKQIVEALQRSQLQIVIVTQQALRDSGRLRTEYELMAMLKRPIIPAMPYPVPDLPKTLQQIPPVDFQVDFHTAFDELLAALSKNLPAEAPAEDTDENITSGEVIPLNDGLSHHIFLSYKRMDGEIMRRVRDDLTEAGFIVWTDELIEKGTPQWQREIEKAIRNTAALLCLLSPEAAQSDYVREELAAAKLFKKPIYLALVRGTREECFIYGFVNSQSTDLRDKDVYTREFPLLVEAMRNRIV